MNNKHIPAYMKIKGLKTTISVNTYPLSKTNNEAWPPAPVIFMPLLNSH